MADLPRVADVVIVGGGVHGASLAYHFARKRAGRVVLVEKEFLASGPTGRSTAMVRRFYSLDFLTRTANRSADVFNTWPEVIGGGDPGFHRIGYIIVAGETLAPHLARNVARAQRLGARVELISRDDLRRLVPQMAVEDVALASYESDSGYADPSSTTTALAGRARELGATLVQFTATTRVLTASGTVRGVETTAGTISAPLVIICAGPWAARLLAPLGIVVEIRSVRHQMAVFERPAELPSHPAIRDLPNNTYMRPDHGHITLHGVGNYDEVVDPDTCSDRADPTEIARNVHLIVRRLPVMEKALVRGGYAGVYDVTPDEQPILGPVPQYEGLHACFGWSGHGFKHAPVIGDIVSDVALYGRSEEYDLTPFRLSRFQEGALLPDGSPVGATGPEWSDA